MSSQFSSVFQWLQVEDAELRSFATGLAQGANNFLGFAMGPMIPQLVMAAWQRKS